MGIHKGHLIPLGGWASLSDHDRLLELVDELHAPARWNCHPGDEFFPDALAYVGVEELDCMIRVDLAEGTNRVTAIFFRVSSHGGERAQELMCLIERLCHEFALVVEPVRHPTWQVLAERSQRVDAVKAYREATGASLADSLQAIDAFVAQVRMRVDVDPDAAVDDGV